MKLNAFPMIGAVLIMLWYALPVHAVERATATTFIIDVSESMRVNRTDYLDKAFIMPVIEKAFHSLIASTRKKDRSKDVVRIIYFRSTTKQLPLMTIDDFIAHKDRLLADIAKRHINKGQFSRREAMYDAFTRAWTVMCGNFDVFNRQRLIVFSDMELDQQREKVVNLTPFTQANIDIYLYLVWRELLPQYRDGSITAYSPDELPARIPRKFKKAPTITFPCVLKPDEQSHGITKEKLAEIRQ